MPTKEKECETKGSKAPKFRELDEYQQIEKLHYELQIALRGIAHIGNKMTTIEKHQHGTNGEVLIDVNRANRAYEQDRSSFLD